MALKWKRWTTAGDKHDPDAADWLMVDGRRYGFVRFEFAGCLTGWRANTADKFPDGYLFDSREDAEAYLETDVIVPGSGDTFCPWSV